jgi:hypothetical protein
MSLTQAQVRSVSCDERILSCVDKGLESVGRNVRNVVYWHLKKLGSVARDDIPQKPLLFVKGLRALYGESSVGVENAILKEINSVFSLNYSIGTDLVAAIFLARSKS